MEQPGLAHERQLWRERLFDFAPRLFRQIGWLSGTGAYLFAAGPIEYCVSISTSASRMEVSAHPGFSRELNT
jgi:hypothetical protein